jgi:SAM-dependent methyltransferase
VVAEADDAATGCRFAVVECKRCGLRFTNPRPDETGIARFYPPSYGPHSKPPRSRFRRSLPGVLGRLHRRLTDPQQFGLPWQGQGRLLDVGCGNGTFLYRMRQQGWNVVGLDVSEAAVDMVRDVLRLPAIQGTLPHPMIPPQSFDVITMWQSLEHMHRPLEALREAYRVLVPGGRLMVSVPNIESAAYRWFSSSWFGLDLPRHLVHFSPSTLEAIVRAAGFEAIQLHTLRHAAWLQQSGRLACRQPQAPRRLRWLSRRTLARLVSWYFHLTGRSDCLLVTAVRPSSEPEAPYG